MQTISEYKVHKFTEHREQEMFMDQVTEFMKNNSNNHKSNICLTEVDLLVDDKEGEDELMFVVVRKELRPGRVDPTWEVEMIPADEAKSLETVVPEMRSKNLPPVNVEVIEEHRFPETDISASYDHVVFTPRATTFLDELDRRGVPTPNFASIEYDVEETLNRPVSGLRNGTKKGIKETKNQKVDVLKKKKKLQDRVSQAIHKTLPGGEARHLSGRSVSARTIKPDNLFNYYKEIVRSNGGKESRLVKQHNCDLRSLKEIKREIDASVDTTELHSVETFEDTIDEGGMELPPNSVSSTEDAISRLGIGKRKFLRID